MKNRLLLLTLMLLSVACARAQFGSFGDIPIEITADGETRFIGGVAVAENNVIIHYGSTSIYADYVQYNPETRDVLAIGNVRLYQEGKLVEGDRALYNLETKQVRALEFDGGHGPIKFSSLSAKGFGTRQFTLRDADLTERMRAVDNFFEVYNVPAGAPAQALDQVELVRGRAAPHHAQLLDDHAHHLEVQLAVVLDNQLPKVGT